jgi:hypothetical protein
MQTFKITYDPKTGEINETTIKNTNINLDEIGKIITYTQANSPTPGINQAMEIIRGDKFRLLGILEVIIGMIKDVESQIDDSKRFPHAMHSEHLRLLQANNLTLSDQGRQPYLNLMRFFNDITFQVGGSILSRLMWLKEEFLK